MSAARDYAQAAREEAAEDARGRELFPDLHRAVAQAANLVASLSTRRSSVGRARYGSAVDAFRKAQDALDAALRGDR